MRTWKLPAVGFIAATYWQSLMFCTVSFVVAYLKRVHKVFGAFEMAIISTWMASSLDETGEGGTSKRIYGEKSFGGFLLRFPKQPEQRCSTRVHGERLIASGRST